MRTEESRKSRARVIFRGTRGTCPISRSDTVRYGGNTSCLELRAPDGTIIVLDAGTGIRPLGLELVCLDKAGCVPGDGVARNRAHSEIHVFLTHRHSDHVMGLPHFAPLHAQGHLVHLHCGDAEGRGIADFIASLLSPPLFPYVEGLAGRMVIDAWPSNGGVQVGQLRVHRFAANHPGGAAIIRVDDINGPLLAYAPDNELALHDSGESHQDWLKALRKYLHRVPLLVHDATFTAQELVRHSGWGHSSDVEALSIASDCNAGSLALFHHHPDRNDCAIDRMLENVTLTATKYDKTSTLKILAASDGLTLDI